MEHDERADDAERELEDMEERSERLGEEIEETKEDYERSKEDDSVPGALPDERRPDDVDDDA